MNFLQTLLRRLKIRRIPDAADSKSADTTSYQVQMEYTANSGGMSSNGSFLYNRRDPYAVQFLFTDLQGYLVTWTFSRDLLILGLNETAGSGDVQIAPEAKIGFEALRITSTDSYGTEHIVMNKRGSELFLEKTFHLVPVGAEEQFIDFDIVLSKLLPTA